MANLEENQKIEARQKKKSKLRQLWIQEFKIGKEDKIETKKLDKINSQE